jgi:hypothetical protein
MGHFWIITHFGNFSIFHQFIIHFNVDLHQAPKPKFELEQRETEHAV